MTSRPRNRLITIVVLCTISVAPLPSSAQTNRIASDFEIQQMERQAASGHDFLSQISAHLNLGDLRLTRNESTLASSEYRIAAATAERGRIEARKASDMARYATATRYAGLAQAKLGSSENAFALLEEATRYTSDDANGWNVYASAMSVMQQPRKAASAARNAVSIAERDLETSPSPKRRLDLTIYQFTLATALNAGGNDDEARRLLEAVVASLRSSDFDAMRKDAKRRESFEIYSTARGETTAYLSLSNRSQLLLAAIYERHDPARAAQLYRDVLASRNDDATALAALARLSSSEPERMQSYAGAFDANPFSIELIRDYQQWLGQHRIEPNEGSSSGAAVRRALEQMARSENHAARSTLETLVAEFPANDVVQYLAAVNDIRLGDFVRGRSRSIHMVDLRRDIDARLGAAVATAPELLDGTVTTATPSASDLRQLLRVVAQQRITPEQRVALDRITFTSTVTLRASSTTAKPGQTVFESGSIEDLPFRFSEPTPFAGTFSAESPLRLTYRVLGATEVDGGDALLVEPLRLEAVR